MPKRKTVEEKRETRRKQAQRYVERKREAGLKQVKMWIPASTEEGICGVFLCSGDVLYLSSNGQLWKKVSVKEALKQANKPNPPA